jgi:phage terminase large subunit-like protein
MAEDAKRMPSREAEYRNLVLNQRVEASNPFVSKSLWFSCDGPVQQDWSNVPVYGGLDLSSVSDLTALVLIGKIKDQWHVKPTFWLPEEGILERSRLDHAQYDIWARDGYLDLTPGKSVEYEYVAERLREIISALSIKKIARQMEFQKPKNGR